MQANPDTTDVPDYRRLLSLEDRGFVVAGAGQGIGRQTAHALATSGAGVVCVDVVADFAEQVALETGGVPFVGDMCERHAVQEALDLATATYGNLAGVVDIIGISKFQFIADTTSDDWEWHQRMNLQHAFLIAQLGGQELARQGGGSIVYVASISGMTGAQKQAAYGAAKAGVISLVKSCAVEMGPVGVRVNAVAPGVIWTPRIGTTLGEKRTDEWASRTPLGRLGSPADIASTALFLSSDLASFTTGQTLIVDGGASQRFPYPLEELSAPEA